MPRLGSRTRLVVRILLAIVALVALLVAVALWEVHRSVPVLDGAAHVPGLQASVTIARDARGTAVVKGASRLDVARGLGFVHAQERFFEMDLTRRSAAGELSELFGALALERDKTRRVHRMRAMLEARYAAMDATDHALLQAYADGVNAGLAQLPTRPWQYVMLRAEPRAWRPVDSLLVIGEMFWMLQGNGVDEALERAQWRQCVGDEMFEVLEPRGGRWDAPLDGSTLPPVALPGPDRLDLRRAVPAAASAVTARATGDDPHEPMVGSNNWAVSGRHTADGGALLANDMHLGLGVPAIWFRAQFEIGSGDAAVRAAGVTLPGVPALVVGSNGHVAWGFTNSYGQWFAWRPVPAGATLTHVTETIAVKGGASTTLAVELLDGHPVASHEGGQAYALDWVADRGAAYNLKLDALLTAPDARTAASIGAQSGIPQQNMVVADGAGHVGWTIAGVRALYVPQDGAIGDTRGRFADGWGEPLAAPTAFDPGAAVASPALVDPDDGLLWTANARVYGQDGAGAAAVKIGDGGVDLGARAQQIRDRLRARPTFDEATLGAIHFDDEALFLAPWAARVAAVSAARPEVLAVLKSWNGRADADQAGYRLVRDARRRTLDALWKAWSTALQAPGRCVKREFDWHARFEYPAAQALADKPAHLLPHGFASWDAFLLAQVDATVADMTRQGARPLAQATWGEKNASHIGHPLARAVPLLSRWLDMPSVPQAGDANMPHVAAPGFGQSERLVVAPGHEERATLSLPGGQSGHPMSPYYGAGHADWVAGRATPLLAGPAEHVLTLSP